MTIGAWRTGYCVVNGFRQFYRDWQPPKEHHPPVLALHGSLTQSGMWIALAERATSIRMLCPDQRGFGLSRDPGSDSCAEFATDAVALAENLIPDRYVVMGHSFACSIALELACVAAKRIIGAVLVDPVVTVGATTATPVALPSESFASMEEAQSHFRDTEEGSWPEEALRQFTQDVMIRDIERGVWRFPYTAARLARLRAFARSETSDYNLFAKAKQLNCPALVFRGGMSKRFQLCAEQPFLDAFVFRPKVVVCSQSGHFPNVSEPDLVISALKQFLFELL